MSHGPIEDDYLSKMNGLAIAIDEAINVDIDNRETGFVLLMFKFGEPKHNGRMNYISNAVRDDVIVALKELTANFEGRGPDSFPEGHA